MAKRNKLEQL
jgi:hypothetical protein